MSAARKEEPATAPDAIDATVEAAAFKSAVKSMMRFAERGPVIPILQCLIIGADGGELSVIAPGIDMQITAHLEGEGSGIVALPARAVRAFCALAEGDSIRIRKDAATARVTLSSGGYEANVTAYPVSDAPDSPWPVDMVPHRSFSLSEVALSPLLRLPAHCMSDEETRYYLNGVCFQIEAGKVRTVATNGHMLASRALPVAHALEAWEETPIVPRFAVAAVLGLMAGQDTHFDFHVTPTTLDTDKNGKKIKRFGHPRARINSDRWTISAKLIDGTFPDWRRVVPKDLTESAALKSGVITRLASAASLVSNSFRSSKAVKLTRVDEKTARLSSYMPLVDGLSMTASVPATVSDKFPEIGFNISYLAGIARILQSDEIKLLADHASNPFLVSAATLSPDDVVVIMPMRV